MRRRFNLISALSYNNAFDNIGNIFSNINTQYGTRMFQRQWLFGWTITEYWVMLMNRMEGWGVPSGITRACKLVFTNNRTDLMVK